LLGRAGRFARRRRGHLCRRRGHPVWEAVDGATDLAPAPRQEDPVDQLCPAMAHVGRL